MPRPKLQIVVLFQNLGERHAYYARCPSPPVSGMLLAALTPELVDVELLHEMVRPIDYETDADYVALSFMDFCARHAFRVAARLRARGKVVVAGGRYPSTFPEACLPHFDAVVAGEAERVWPQVVEDLVTGRLRRLYRAPLGPSLEGIPPPRYDLAEPSFAAPVITEATRGCPFRCTYCALNIRPTAHRCRPIDDVLRDLTATARLPVHKRKLAMLCDNNLGGDRQYAKDLLREIAKLDLWALGAQFTFDCLKDDEFLDLFAEARGTMAFIGLESMNQPSLAAVKKRQNRVREYRYMFDKLKERGIITFTGIMFALAEDTPAYYRDLPAKLDEVDPSAILPSISIPIPGTPFHRELQAEGRIVDHDLAHYEGDHLVFLPSTVTPHEVLGTYQRVNRSFYAWSKIVRRWWRLLRRYWSAGWTLAKLGRSALVSYVFFKLSVFERDHALQKVYTIEERHRALLERVPSLENRVDGSERPRLSLRQSRPPWPRLHRRRRAAR
jgi:radical SAM superfamily enzyme YgiQ (UPF0313 family)